MCGAAQRFGNIGFKKPQGDERADFTVWKDGIRREIKSILYGPVKGRKGSELEPETYVGSIQDFLISEKPRIQRAALSSPEGTGLYQRYVMVLH